MDELREVNDFLVEIASVGRKNWKKSSSDYSSQQSLVTTIDQSFIVRCTCSVCEAVGSEAESDRFRHGGHEMGYWLRKCIVRLRLESREFPYAQVGLRMAYDFFMVNVCMIAAYELRIHMESDSQAKLLSEQLRPLHRGLLASLVSTCQSWCSISTDSIHGAEGTLDASKGSSFSEQ